MHQVLVDIKYSDASQPSCSYMFREENWTTDGTTYNYRSEISTPARRPDKKINYYSVVAKNKIHLAN